MPEKGGKKLHPELQRKRLDFKNVILSKYDEKTLILKRL